MDAVGATAILDDTGPVEAVVVVVFFFVDLSEAVEVAVLLDADSQVSSMKCHHSFGFSKKKNCVAVNFSRNLNNSM